MFEVGDIVKYHNPTVQKNPVYYLVISRDLLKNPYDFHIPDDATVVKVEGNLGWGYFCCSEYAEKIDV